jgi:DNA polymerase I-like protein with 3'-5' exonuclease and polymerase domains
MLLPELKFDHNPYSSFRTLIVSNPTSKYSESILILTRQTLDASAFNSNDLILQTQLNPLKTILTRDCQKVKALVLASFDGTGINRKKYIKKLIKRYNAKAVVLSGFNIAADLLGRSAMECAELQNRIVNTSMFNVPIIPTWGYGTVFSVDPEKFKTDCSLAGFFVEGIKKADVQQETTIDVSADYEIIDTIEKFDDIYKLLTTENIVSLDIETATVPPYQILTIQFCFDDVKAYVLPYMCKDSPFISGEVNYIKKKLKEWIIGSKNQIILGHNIVFDITKLRHEFNLRYMPFKIWDTGAGEYFLDENRKFMRPMRFMDSNNENNRFKAYALETLVTKYSGQYPYRDGQIGKDDRVRLNNYHYEEYAPYCAKDVLYPFRIMKEQIKIAKSRGPTYKKYELLMTNLATDMIHMFSEMNYIGSKMDIQELRRAGLYNSPINQRIKDIKNQFTHLPSVKKANKILINKAIEKGEVVSNSLFDKTPTVFQINKVESQQTLFFDVLNLKPTSVGKSGRPSIGKKFKEIYKGVKEVSLLEELSQAEKANSTYIKKYLILAENSPYKDGRIRATFDFLDVTTFRSSSYNPNFQNNPSHSKDAEIIASFFITEPLGILIKADFNAHEIRQWGNVARDSKIASAFKIGMELRTQIRIWHLENYNLSHKLYKWFTKNKWEKASFEEKTNLTKKSPSKFKKILNIYLDLEAKGDVHKRNYEFFYKVPAQNVTKTQRQAVKATVFGALYDKSAPSIGITINQEAADKIIYNPSLSPNEKEELLQPFYDQGKEILNKMFTTFKEGAKFIDETKKFAQKTFTVVSPVGFVRHLWGYYTDINGLVGNMNRRGPNSIIQGLSSNMAYAAGRIFQTVVNRTRDYGVELDVAVNKMVHDSLELELLDLVMLPIVLYYLEHSLTTLVSKKFEQLYGFSTYINLEAEFALGPNLRDLIKYESNEPSLLNIINNTLDAYKEKVKFNRKKLIKDIITVSRRVDAYRLQELKLKEGFKVEKSVMLTPDKIPDILKGIRSGKSN